MDNTMSNPNSQMPNDATMVQPTQSTSISNQGAVPVVQTQQAQPVQPVSQPVQQQPLQQSVQQPIPPISVGRSKEMPAMPSTEWVTSSNPEIVLPQEVEAAGVEVKSTAPVISQQLQQMGVQPAKEVTPVTTVQAEPLTMKTPRSVLEQLKQTHKKVTEGFSWLIRLVIKEQDKQEKGASL